MLPLPLLPWQQLRARGHAISSERRRTRARGADAPMALSRQSAAAMGAPSCGHLCS
jgi:hypothetical protein